MRQIVTLAIVSMLVGCGSNAVSGTLSHAITGKPLEGVTLIAKATSEGASMTCLGFDAVTAADGSFKLPNLCSGTAYEIKPKDETLWIPGGMIVPAEGAPGPFETKAWRAPKAPGLFLLDIESDKIESIKSTTDLKTEKILSSDETAQYPETVPGKLTVVAPGKMLVISGKLWIQGTTVSPLIPSGERNFDGERPVTMQPWNYIGIEFESDTVFKRVTSPFEASKVQAVDDGERMVNYIAHDALEQGRYAVVRKDDRRVTLLDFGAAKAKEPAAE